MYRRTLIQFHLCWNLILKSLDPNQGRDDSWRLQWRTEIQTQSVLPRIPEKFEEKCVRVIDLGNGNWSKMSILLTLCFWCWLSKFLKCRWPWISITNFYLPFWGTDLGSGRLSGMWTTLFPQYPFSFRRDWRWFLSFKGVDTLGWLTYHSRKSC